MKNMKPLLSPGPLELEDLQHLRAAGDHLVLHLGRHPHHHVANLLQQVVDHALAPATAPAAAAAVTTPNDSQGTFP